MLLSLSVAGIVFCGGEHNTENSGFISLNSKITTRNVSVDCFERDRVTELYLPSSFSSYFVMC